MATVFHGERNAAAHGSGLTGVYYNNGSAQLHTPPDDYSFPDKTRAVVASGGGELVVGADVTAWLEIWDYAGGASFRGFVAENGADKSLFAFFDAGIIGRDLKQA